MAGDARWPPCAEGCTARWLLARCLRAKAGAELADPSAAAARLCPSPRGKADLSASRLPSIAAPHRPSRRCPHAGSGVWEGGTRGRGSAAPDAPRPVLSRVARNSLPQPELCSQPAQGGRTGCLEGVPPALLEERR